MHEWEIGEMNAICSSVLILLPGKGSGVGARGREATTVPAVLPLPWPVPEKDYRGNETWARTAHPASKANRFAERSTASLPSITTQRKQNNNDYSGPKRKEILW
jgi:hypothetical protein